MRPCASIGTLLGRALDRTHLQSLFDERQLVHDSRHASRVQRIREDVERADAHRLQPHRAETIGQEHD